MSCGVISTISKSMLQNMVQPLCTVITNADVMLAGLLGMQLVKNGKLHTENAKRRNSISAGSFNGRTAVFETAYVGSIPTPATNLIALPPARS